jgi:hypothetical protein
MPLRPTVPASEHRGRQTSIHIRWPGGLRLRGLRPGVSPPASVAFSSRVTYKCEALDGRWTTIVVAILREYYGTPFHGQESARGRFRQYLVVSFQSVPAMSRTAEGKRCHEPTSANYPTGAALSPRPAGLPRTSGLRHIGRHGGAQHHDKDHGRLAHAWRHRLHGARSANLSVAFWRTPARASTKTLDARPALKRSGTTWRRYRPWKAICQ